MDILGAAASAVAIAEVLATLGSKAATYCKGFREADQDILNLRREADSLIDVLDGVLQLLEGHGDEALPVAERLAQHVAECCKQISALSDRLKHDEDASKWSKLVRQAKWPLIKKSIESAIAVICRWRGIFCAALQVDATSAILHLSRSIDFSKLPEAKSATFDSYENEYEPFCYPNTRVGLLQQVETWAGSAEGSCIFWLRGMAGTGKSTVARTVSRLFSKQKQLAASFFFKRGESDRGNTRLLFTTIAAQLVRKVPFIAPYLRAALEEEPDIPHKTLRQQFDRLILEPLSRLPADVGMPTLFVIIDALDECDREQDMGAIVRLLAETKSLTSVRIRIFLTSRPETPIRLGFQAVPADVHQDVVLHDIPEDVVKHDIATFLAVEFIVIRDTHALPETWPGMEALDALRDIASPLFIYASTLCRFIGDPRGRFSPTSQLERVLKQKSSSLSQIDRTYQPILEQLLVGLEDDEIEILVRDFQKIVGTIVLLFDPLSAESLARLLSLPTEDVKSHLSCLHSVLNVPQDERQPVRLLHLSFRDFLLAKRKVQSSIFLVNESAMHWAIAQHCLELMDRLLKRDLCHLKSPGSQVSEVDQVILQSCVPAELSYACLHWVSHVCSSGQGIRDGDEVDTFLRKHMLHWFEALSLLGRMSDSVSLVMSLKQQALSQQSQELSIFLNEAERLTVQHTSLISRTPLQLYSSVLIFLPSSSRTKAIFAHEISKWITRLPSVDAKWSTRLQTVNARSFTPIAFSADGTFLAASNKAGGVDIWDSRTGVCKFTTGSTHLLVKALAFSSRGTLLIGTSHDVQEWDLETVICLSILYEGLNACEFTVFSRDGSYFALCDGGKIWIRGASKASSPVNLPRGHKNTITAMAFSHDHTYLASGSYDHEIIIWDVYSGELQARLKGHSGSVDALAFSPAETLASASSDGDLYIWNSDWTLSHIFSMGNSITSVGNSITALAFSGLANDTNLAYTTHAGGLRIHNIVRREQYLIHRENSRFITHLQFSSDGSRLASSDKDGLVSIWDPSPTAEVEDPARHAVGHGIDDVIETCFVDAEATLMLSKSDWSTVLWDLNNSTEKWCWAFDHEFKTTDVTLSGDFQRMAVLTGDECYVFDRPAFGSVGIPSVAEKISLTFTPVAAALSEDGRLVAFASPDKAICIQSADGQGRTYDMPVISQIRSLDFSPNSSHVAFVDTDGNLAIWNFETGELIDVSGDESAGDPMIYQMHITKDGSLVGFSGPGWSGALWFCRFPDTRIATRRGHRVLISPDAELVRHQDESVLIDRRSIYNRGFRVRVHGGVRGFSLRDYETSLLTIGQHSDGTWLMRNYVPMLSLPPADRITSSCFGISGDKVGLGHVSGKVTVIGFDFSKLET